LILEKDIILQIILPNRMPGGSSPSTTVVSLRPYCLLRQFLHPSHVHAHMYLVSAHFSSRPTAARLRRLSALRSLECRWTPCSVMRPPRRRRWSSSASSWKRTTQAELEAQNPARGSSHATPRRHSFAGGQGKGESGLQSMSTPRRNRPVPPAYFMNDNIAPC